MKRLLLVILLIGFSCVFSHAQSKQIIVDGDKVEFFEKENKIVAEGHVSITYGDVRLSCDKIEVNTKTQVAVCRGNVRVEHPDGVIEGDHIVYDFLKGRGEIVGGEVAAYPWFGQAKESRKVGDNEYLLKKGYITTCDLDAPHYRVAGEEIRVFPDDKIIAKNVVFYVGKVPVLWFPYYYHPIIQSRAKVQFMPGKSSEWGYFLLSAWRFYIKGNTKVDVLADYRAKKGFAEGADIYYYADDVGLSGLGKGLFRSYFIHQNDRGTYDPTPWRDEGTGPELRKRFQWFHRIDFDSRTVGMLEFNKLSDEFFLKDYFYNEYEEINKVPKNQVSLISAQPNFMFNLNAEKRFDDFYTVTQKLPEVKLDVPDQRLRDTFLYYKSEMSGTVFDKEYAFESRGSEEVNRLDSFHKLSHATKLGFLNLVPFGQFRGTMYTRDKWEDDFTSRAVSGGGLNASCRFHRVFDVTTDVLRLDINGLRHIIVPVVEYFHAHQPTVDKNNLYQMDDIDSLEKENKISLSLVSKLQTKRHVGGKLQGVDLARFEIGTDYFFRMKKGELDFKDDDEFGDISLELDLDPYEWLYLETDVEIATDNQSIKTGSAELSLHPGNRFRMDLNYRYTKEVSDPQNHLAFDTRFKLSPKWRFGWYERFNLHNGTIEGQQFSVVRDLHCWEVEFTYNVEGSNFLEDEQVFWLVFKIKAFPDLPIALDRSFMRRPTVGAHR